MRKISKLAAVILAVAFLLPSSAKAQVDEEVIASWFLGEGATHSGFQYFVEIANPSSSDALVEIKFLAESSGVITPDDPPGGRIQNGRATIPGKERFTVRVNDYIGPENVSTVVDVLESLTAGGVNVIVDGSLTRAGSLTTTTFQAVSQPSTNWYFAQGASHSGFGTTVAVANPNDEATQIDLKVLTETQGLEIFQMTLFSNSRRTFDINALLSERRVDPDNFSIEVVSTDDKPVVMYASMNRFQPALPGRAPADFIHSSAPGVPSTATQWFLAESDTHSGFGSYVLIGNHDTIPATVNIRFLQANGAPVPGPTQFVPAGERRTVHVNAFVPNVNAGVEVKSVTSNQSPRPAGISVYASQDRINRNGAALDFTPAVPATSLGWVSAQGDTRNGVATFLQVVNPNATDTQFSVEALVEDGTPAMIASNEVVPAGKRKTIDMNVALPNQSFGLRVFVPNTGTPSAPAGPPVVAEVTLNEGEITNKSGYGITRHSITPTSASGTPFGPPSAPSGVAVVDPKDDANSLEVSWNSSSSASGGYHVYRAVSEDGPFRRLTIAPLPLADCMRDGALPTDPKRCVFRDRNLTTGQNYYYEITALNSYLNESDRSATATGKPTNNS